MFFTIDYVLFDMGVDVDEIDRAILYLLQSESRNRSPADMAEQLPVSAGTVRNRLDRLESRGIIEGYTTHVRYETIGYPLLVVFSCHAPLLERSTYAERAADLPNVVTVRELVTGRYNVRVTAVVSDIDEITAIAMKLDEIGLSIEREELVGHEHRRPFEPFADAITDTM